MSTASFLGPDIFGRQSKMNLYATKQHGWWWQYDPESEPVLVSPALLEYRKRRLILRKGESVLNLHEHIGALRWAGFNGVVISSDSWPPYYGRSLEIYRTMHRSSEESDWPISWCELNQEVCVEYPGPKRRFIKIIPGVRGALDLVVTCAYKGLGEKTLRFRLPAAENELEKIFGAFAPGWPTIPYYLGWLLYLFGWPHLDRTLWLNSGRTRNEVLELAVLHRVTDILGALSLMHPFRLLSGTVVSHCSGHWADVEAIRRAQGHVRIIT